MTEFARTEISAIRRAVLLRWPQLDRLMASWAASAHFVFAADERRQLVANLSAAFPDHTSMQIRRLARRVGVISACDRSEQRRFEISDEIQIMEALANVKVRGIAHMQAAVQSGRPVLLVTPHYGHYMLGARKVAEEFRERGVYFFYNPPERNPYAESSDRLLDRPDRGCHKIYNNTHGIKTALKALRAGGILCMMPDLISVTSSAIYVPFFGRFFTAMAGIAFLAVRSNALLVPVYCYSERGRTTLEYRPSLDSSAIEGSGPDVIHALTAALFRELEHKITHRPEHWRYWHIFLKRSLAFPKPPQSKIDLIEQLQDSRTDRLVSEDTELQGIIREWAAMLAGPGENPKRSKLPVFRSG